MDGGTTAEQQRANGSVTPAHCVFEPVCRVFVPARRVFSLARCHTRAFAKLLLFDIAFRVDVGLRFDELGTLDPFDKSLLPGIVSRDTLDASSGLDIL